MASIVQHWGSLSFGNETQTLEIVRNQAEGLLAKYVLGLGGWQLSLTVLLLLIAYDQCLFSRSS
jgi:hypothetical protein